MKSRTKWEKLKKMTDAGIDVSDVPEIDPKLFKRGGAHAPAQGTGLDPH
jgi:hypothetical protein